MNLKTAARRLGVHYQTAYRWVRSGELVAVKVGAGYEISEAALERFQGQRAAMERVPAMLERDAAARLDADRRRARPARRADRVHDGRRERGVSARRAHVELVARRRGDREPARGRRVAAPRRVRPSGPGARGAHRRDVAVRRARRADVRARVPRTRARSCSFRRCRNAKSARRSDPSSTSASRKRVSTAR